MTLHYDTVDKMQLVIPDKQVILQVVGNITYGELMVDANTAVMVEMSLFDVEMNSGGRKLKPEGSVQSFSRYPNKNIHDWDQYQCVPMYNREGWSTVTIITGGNANCETLWNKVWNGCSMPPAAPKSDFLWAHTPACRGHDTCKFL